LLVFNQNGIYCPRADVYIDPWKPVRRAIITHAHSDHARWGNQYYLAHHHSIPILQNRLGSSITVEGTEYGTVHHLHGVKISFHPAGHVVGSSQIRLEHQGEVWVVSGDYKLQDDHLSTPFESVKCQHFITESTFGMPHYRFPEPETVHQQITDWWKSCKENGKNAILIGYALGKAQRLLKHLDPSMGRIIVHGAVDTVNQLITRMGYELPTYEKVTPDSGKKEFKDCLIIAPPSALNSPWIKRFEPYSVGIASGWMQLRGYRRRQSVDRGFVLSDHADWDALNQAVIASGAENIYVTHGYKSVFAKWLREKNSLNAVEVETLFEGESLINTEKEDEEIR
jgi:putative mRNA 3-end processing factor